MSPAGRAKLLAMCLLAGGGAVALYSGNGLAAAFSEVSTRAPIVALDAIDATGFLAGLGVILIGIVAMLPVGAPEATTRGRSLPKIPRAAKPILIAAGVLIVASPIAASIVRAIVTSRAEDGGYVRCPRTPWPRKQPDRWAFPDAAGATDRCPRGDPAP